MNSRMLSILTHLNRSPCKEATSSSAVVIIPSFADISRAGTKTTMVTPASPLNGPSR